MGPPASCLETLSLGPQRGFTQGMTWLDLHFVKLPGFVGKHTDERLGRGWDDEALLCPGQRRRGQGTGPLVASPASMQVALGKSLS